MRVKCYDILVGFHFDIIARNEAFPTVQLSPVPVHVIFHVQDLEIMQLNRGGCISITLTYF